MLSILIPYRPDGGARDRAWAWCRYRWETMFRDVELIVASDDGGENPGHFNHPLAINRAAAKASGDVLLIGDADTAFDEEWVREAHRLVATGEAPWVLPSHYRKVTEDGTRKILGTHPTDPIPEHDTEWIGECVSWSGLVVVPAASFDVTGGYDERFEYWGADDHCFGITTDTLWGRHHRLSGNAYHLWHPAPLGETYGHDRHREQHRLDERYQAAAGDPDAIREVRFS